MIMFQAKADDNNYAAVDIFLTTLGLHELIPIFRNERIDAHVLNYLEDNDLKAGCPNIYFIITNPSINEDVNSLQHLQQILIRKNKSNYLINHNRQIIHIHYQTYMDTLYNIIVIQDMLIPVGSRKRIIRAIEDRRSDLESDRPIEDSRL